jgi:hypothetical protein
MSNKTEFIKNCILLINETDTLKQKSLADEAITIFEKSKMIENTPDEFKIYSLLTIKETLLGFIVKNGTTVSDVKQVYILQSEFIDD